MNAMHVIFSFLPSFLQEGLLALFKVCWVPLAIEQPWLSFSCKSKTKTGQIQGNHKWGQEEERKEYHVNWRQMLSHCTAFSSHVQLSRPALGWGIITLPLLLRNLWLRRWSWLRVPQLWEASSRLEPSSSWLQNLCSFCYKTSILFQHKNSEYSV